MGFTLLATVVTVISGIVGLLFILRPDLKPDPPSPTRSVKLTEEGLNPEATFATYLARLETAQPGEYTRRKLAERGVVVSVRTTIIGYKGADLPLTWQLFDEAGQEAGKTYSYLITPQANSDTANVDLWVPLPREQTGPFFVGVKLLLKRETGSIVLDREETKSFAGLEDA